MDVDYFEHDADVGLIGRGPTVERAFQHAAEALFAVMAPELRDEGTILREVSFVEPDLELALVTWLNLLIAEARIDHLILTRFLLQRDHDRWVGRAWGLPWRPDIERGVEVKGATLTALSVRQAEDGWEARCVVDV